MTTIIIPRMSELRQRLNGIERLLTTSKWERAAIVFAYTEAQTNKGSGRRPGVSEGKYNIRNFAGLGITGLSTPKAVARYRQAWITAIDKGWAVPVEPGQTIELPDEPFPAWPYGEGTTWEDVAAPRGRGPNRPLAERVYSSLDRASLSIRQLAEVSAEEPLSDAEKVQLVERLTTVRDEADGALRALQGRPVGV